MTSKIIHKTDLSCKYANVCAAFSVNVKDDGSILQASILSALKQTVTAIPVLTYILDEKAEADGIQVYGHSAIPLEDSFSYTIESNPVPVGEAVAKQLVEESRRPADISKSLFALKAIQHSNGLAFYLVVNHTITDGPSLFKIVDIFLQYLAAQIDSTFTVTPSPAVDRDVIGEVLANPVSSTKPAEDSILNQSFPNLLTAPALTDTNTDAAHNGCIRVVYRELSAELTARILQNCRANGVSFQSLLSSATALAFLKLLHSHGELTDAQWDAPLIQMTNANMRRYLSPGDDNQSVDSIISHGAAFIRWRVEPLQSYAVLAARPFWSDFVLNDAQKPILKAVNSSELLQSVYGGETGSIPFETQRYSVHSTSLGNLAAVQKHYGALTVDDIHMHAGMWAHSQEHFDHPAVHASLINTNTPGIFLMHAYTSFGRLRLTGEYYAYSEQFATPYYDELEHVLVAAGSAMGASEGVKVGELFVL